MMWWPRWVTRCRSAPRRREGYGAPHGAAASGRDARSWRQGRPRHLQHSHAWLSRPGTSRLRAIPPPHVATGPLRLVQGEVCGLIKAVQRSAVIREYGHANTRTALHLRAVDRHRHHEALDDPVTDVLDVGGRRILRHQHSKLIATQTGYAVRLAHGRLQPDGRFNQQRIPGVVAKRVVDLLEAIEV